MPNEWESGVDVVQKRWFYSKRLLEAIENTTNEYLWIVNWQSERGLSWIF